MADTGTSYKDTSASRGCRYFCLMVSRGENTAREKAFLVEQNQVYLKEALRMPMFNNLPTRGFKYDWDQFLINGGLFWIPRGGSFSSDAYEIINGRVKHLNSGEMDIYCANVFNKAAARLETDDQMWPTYRAMRLGLPRDLGFQFPDHDNFWHKLVFWDWVMKIVAARAVWVQENSDRKRQGFTGHDAIGDINMVEQSSGDESVPEPLSLTAQAVDRFNAMSESKFGALPGTESLFGSRVGSGGAQWMGWRLPSRSSPAFVSLRRVLCEAQNYNIAAQGSSKGDASGGLVVEVHDTTIEEGRTAATALANLDTRTTKPLKQRRDDTEESGATTTNDAPPNKMPKVSEDPMEMAALAFLGDASSRMALDFFINLSFRRRDQLRASNWESGADMADDEPLEKATKDTQGHTKTSGSPTQLDER